MAAWRRYWQCAITAVLAIHTSLVRAEESDPLGERSLQARADTIPSAIGIAPSQYWDGNDGPWSSFPIQVGGGRSQTQNVRVFVSTAAYNIWTIGARGCPDNFVQGCADKRGFLFLPNQSLTWVANSVYSPAIEANLGLDTVAPVGYDTVTLGWQGSGGPSLEHRVVFNVYDQRWWLGLFGVNPQPTNFTTLSDPQPSFMQTLYDNNSIPSLAYGYTAGNQYRFNKIYGSLTLGGSDTNRYTGGISWSMYADISRDLLVNIKSITTDAGSSAGSTTDLLPGGQISAYVDSTVPALWLPDKSCRAFVQAFGLTYNTTLGYHIVNGSTHQDLVSRNPNVSITLTNGNQDVAVTLPYAAFDLNLTQPIVPTTQYYFPLQCAANDTQYTLGRTFLQEAYLIADYNRRNFTIAPCLWDQNKIGTSSLKSILSPGLTAIVDSGSSKLSAGAIAGIVIGAVVLIVLLVALFIFLRRRKVKKQHKLAELDEKGDGTNGMHYMTADAKVAGDARLEAAGTQLNEMDAPFRPKASEMESPHKVDPMKHGFFEMNGADAHGKSGRYEMDGTRPIYEMQGGEVHELADNRRTIVDGS